MVKRIFWEDPYLTELDTAVNKIDGDWITVKETCFYAFSGGQASDIGTFNGLEVVEAKKDLNEIWYFVPNHSFQVGDVLFMHIDWEHRYRVMRLHFAAELILELVYQIYGYPDKLGANITSDKARLDFAWDGNIKDIFDELYKRVDQIVLEDLPIETGFDDEEALRRYWKIDGFAKVPCGGTHVRSTKEVGSITLKRVNPGKGKERIEITLN